MKLIQKSNDINEANELVGLLEENGVPATVNENGLRNRGTHMPEGNEVWIYINSQYSEALKLIKDKNHKIENSVDINEFYKNIESTEAKELLSQLKSSFIKYGVISIIIIVVVTAVYINAKT